MMQIYFRFLFVTCLTIGFSAPLFAEEEEADVELSDQQKACQKALDNAENAMINAANREVAVPAQVQTAQSQPAATNGAQVMAEAVQKLGEIEQAKTEKIAAVNDEAFKQHNKCKENLHEYNKQMVLQKEKEKDCTRDHDAQIRKIQKTCKASAREQYVKLKDDSQRRARANQLGVGSVQRLQGSRGRLGRLELALERECLRDAASDFKDVEAALTSCKDKSVALTCNIISDIQFVEGRIPEMLNYMEGKKEDINSAANQAIGMTMMGAALAAAGAAQANNVNTAQANDGTVVAGSTRNAVHTMANMSQIRNICGNEGVGQAIAVPADLYPFFTAVNRECRPDASASSFCVKSTGVSSATSSPVAPASK